MIVLDTNIIIYASLQQYEDIRYLIQSSKYSTSIISKVEVLGYSKITTSDKLFFETTFKLLELLPVNLTIIDVAIEIRQFKKMSLGDSIIAATAIFYNAELYTRNVADFSHLDIKVFNPIP